MRPRSSGRAMGKSGKTSSVRSTACNVGEAHLLQIRCAAEVTRSNTSYERITRQLTEGSEVQISKLESEQYFREQQGISMHEQAIELTSVAKLEHSNVMRKMIDDSAPYMASGEQIGIFDISKCSGVSERFFQAGKSKLDTAKDSVAKARAEINTEESQAYQRNLAELGEINHLLLLNGGARPQNGIGRLQKQRRELKRAAKALLANRPDLPFLKEIEHKALHEQKVAESILNKFEERQAGLKEATERKAQEAKLAPPENILDRFSSSTFNF